MVERVRQDLLVAIQERLAAKGITPESALEGLPVGGVCTDSIPYAGSIHLPMGRVISRSDSDRRFKGLRR